MGVPSRGPPHPYVRLYFVVAGAKKHNRSKLNRTVKLFILLYFLLLLCFIFIYLFLFLLYLFLHNLN